MSDRSVKQLTLREMLKESEQRCRELSDHLERHFVPRITALQRSVPPRHKTEELSDDETRAVCHQLQTVVESHAFAQKTFERLRLLLQSIDEATLRVIETG